MSLIRDHTLSLTADCHSSTACCPLSPQRASCSSGRDLWVQSPCVFSFAWEAGGSAPAPVEQMRYMGYPVTAESTGDEIYHTLA